MASEEPGALAPKACPGRATRVGHQTPAAACRFIHPGWWKSARCPGENFTGGRGETAQDLPGSPHSDSFQAARRTGRGGPRRAGARRGAPSPAWTGPTWTPGGSGGPLGHPGTEGRGERTPGPAGPSTLGRNPTKTTVSDARGALFAPPFARGPPHLVGLRPAACASPRRFRGALRRRSATRGSGDTAERAAAKAADLRARRARAGVKPQGLTRRPGGLPLAPGRRLSGGLGELCAGPGALEPPERAKQSVLEPLPRRPGSEPRTVARRRPPLARHGGLEVRRSGPPAMHHS